MSSKLNALSLSAGILMASSMSLAQEEIGRVNLTRDRIADIIHQVESECNSRVIRAGINWMQIRHSYEDYSCISEIVEAEGCVITGGVCSEDGSDIEIKCSPPKLIA